MPKEKTLVVDIEFIVLKQLMCKWIFPFDGSHLCIAIGLENINFFQVHST